MRSQPGESSDWKGCRCEHDHVVPHECWSCPRGAFQLRQDTTEDRRLHRSTCRPRELGPWTTAEPKLPKWTSLKRYPAPGPAGTWRLANSSNAHVSKNGFFSTPPSERAAVSCDPRIGGARLLVTGYSTHSTHPLSSKPCLPSRRSTRFQLGRTKDLRYIRTHYLCIQC